MHPGFQQKGRAEVIAHSHLFSSSRLPLRHSGIDPSDERFNLPSAVLTSTPRQARQAAAFRRILSILVVAAAPPPTVCPVCPVCPAMWMPDPKRDGHQPQAPGVSVASAAMASGVVGHGVGRWDAIVGDGMESLNLFWHLVARFGAVVRLNRFARLWSCLKCDCSPAGIEMPPALSVLFSSKYSTQKPLLQRRPKNGPNGSLLHLPTSYGRTTVIPPPQRCGPWNKRQVGSRNSGTAPPPPPPTAAEHVSVGDGAPKGAWSHARQPPKAYFLRSWWRSDVE